MNCGFQIVSVALISSAILGDFDIVRHAIVSNAVISSPDISTLGDLDFFRHRDIFDKTVTIY